MLDAAVRAIFAAEDYMARDANWAQKIAARVRTTPEEVKSATELFQFRIEFTPRFLDDLVAQAEWAISAGVARRPSQDLRALFTSLIHAGPVRKYRPDRVTLTGV